MVPLNGISLSRIYVLSPGSVKSSERQSNPLKDMSGPKVEAKTNINSNETDSLLSPLLLDHLNHVLCTSDNTSFPPSYAVEIIGKDSYLIIEVCSCMIDAFIVCFFEILNESTHWFLKFSLKIARHNLDSFTNLPSSGLTQLQVQLYFPIRS